MTFEVLTPVVSPLRTVPAEWIDYNGHMNVGYYSLAFDKGVDVLLDLVGVGVARSGSQYWITHVYLRP